ncbi:MAG: leucyl aminopeptidase [Bacteroidetes bacterium]|nr:leucyl aminopeptidase [Bacteroidota bacterium]
MDIKIQKTSRRAPSVDTAQLFKSVNDLKNFDLSKDELTFARREIKLKRKIIEVNRFKQKLVLVHLDHSGTKNQQYEATRRQGYSALTYFNKSKSRRLVISSSEEKEFTLAFAEGLLLGNYQFLKYKKDADEKENRLEEIDIYSKEVSANDIETLSIVTEAVYNTRDFVNEPLSALNAVKFSEEVKKLGDACGAKVEVFNKKKIESLRMGGLLAVNKGSIDPPTFTIFEWKPKDKVNKKPIILVGKGVMYDTGGLSLKPTNYMDTMKCDMAGGAAVAGALYAIAKAKLPVHVIGMIPATDNRPDGNAYVPGDVITMLDGTTVEVLNTDAEGRMILADALSYAKNYDPELVIDIATLTGSAAAALGENAIVGMCAKSEKEFHTLQKSGMRVNERIIEFPFWDEYKDMLKSTIADLKNIGGAYAGAITAGKFLEHFTDYPYIHLDIAGPAFIKKRDSYRVVGGTGIGVRLFFEFIRSKAGV